MHPNVGAVDPDFPLTYLSYTVPTSLSSLLLKVLAGCDPELWILASKTLVLVCPLDFTLACHSVFLSVVCFLFFFFN